jgi:alanine dehydrogenase
MTGTVAKTSTFALTSATLIYALKISNQGWKKALRKSSEIKLGANVLQGEVPHKSVAKNFGLELTPADELL